jgi:dolichol-phosphate mannosyltransferase
LIEAVAGGYPEVPPTASWKRLPRLLSVVCPVFKEEAGIAAFAQRLLQVLDRLQTPYEVVFVEDDSPDGSLAALRQVHANHPTVVKVLSLSRRFGHQASLAAGFHHSHGDVVLCMDSDLQHPPELIPRMLHHWSEGYQLVYTCRDRQCGRGVIKETLSKLFYQVLNRLSDVAFEEGTADFRLMDRSVVDALNLFEEQTLFFRGLVNWIGYRRIAVHFDAPPRFAGESHYTFRRMLSMALDALFSFSLVPLRLSYAIGSLGMLLCLLYGIWIVTAKLLGVVDSAGFTSLALLIMFMGSLNLVCLGITAEYIGRIHRQTQNRPLYLIKEQIPLEPLHTGLEGQRDEVRDAA